MLVVGSERAPANSSGGASVSSRVTPPSPPQAQFLDTAGFRSSLHLLQLLLQDLLYGGRCQFILSKASLALALH